MTRRRKAPSGRPATKQPTYDRTDRRRPGMWPLLGLLLVLGLAAGTMLQLTGNGGDRQPSASASAQPSAPAAAPAPKPSTPSPKPTAAGPKPSETSSKPTVTKAPVTEKPARQPEAAPRPTEQKDATAARSAHRRTPGAEQHTDHRTPPKRKVRPAEDAAAGREHGNRAGRKPAHHRQAPCADRWHRTDPDRHTRRGPEHEPWFRWMTDGGHRTAPKPVVRQRDIAKVHTFGDRSRVHSTGRLHYLGVEHDYLGVEHDHIGVGHDARSQSTAKHFRAHRPDPAMRAILAVPMDLVEG